MHLLQTIGDKGLLLMLRRNVVAEVHGIRLVSFVPDSQFATIITHGLRLVYEHDGHRFRRVQKHFDWIFNQAHSEGARWGQCFPRIRACQLDFEFDPATGDALAHAAGYASLIVHEATHAAIHARGIEMTEQNRDRMERLCYAEQNRSLTRLRICVPGLEESLAGKYDRPLYEKLASTSRWRDFGATLRRASRRSPFVKRQIHQ